MHAQPADISALLALTGATTLLGLAGRCEAGLPVESLDALAKCFGPYKQAVLDTLFSESTLRRRRRQGKLSPEESDQVFRLATTWQMARESFRELGKAQRFLMTEHPLLGGRRPLDVSRASTAGYQAVEDLLGRLKYGSAA